MSEINYEYCKRKHLSIKDLVIQLELDFVEGFCFFYNRFIGVKEMSKMVVYFDDKINVDKMFDLRDTKSKIDFIDYIKGNREMAN